MHSFLPLHPGPQDVAVFGEDYTRPHNRLVEARPGMRDLSYSFDVTVPHDDGTYAAALKAEPEDRATLTSPPEAKPTADPAGFATGGVVRLKYERVRDQ